MHSNVSDDEIRINQTKTTAFGLVKCGAAPRRPHDMRRLGVESIVDKQADREKASLIKAHEREEEFDENDM